MKRIIIFHFDRKVRICQNHLKIIQQLNPGIAIHGVYGGKEKDFSKYKENLSSYFETLYCIKGQLPDWKWKNFDIALRDWYKSIGYKIDFDMAYVIEWDLLLTDSIEHIYSHIKNGEVGVTILNKLSTIEKEWYWTTKEPYKSEWNQLLAFVQKKFHYSQVPYASLGPGFCFPKSFIKKYSEVEVPALVHDELRVPLYAQILNFTLKDTGLTKSWSNEKEYKYFNCTGRKELFITLTTIHEEMKKQHGRKAFHPFRNYITNFKI